PRPVRLFGAPEGHDAAVIGGLLAESGSETWLHVCRDDGRMARFAAALGFFHPGLTTLTFPAWDCLPYDRVSPNGEITSRRIDTLTRLAGGAEAKPLVVLTTINALVQRVPPRRLFDGRVLSLGPGGRVPLDRLQSFFRNNGYTRTDTVREPGEFAVRGGIVDLYPAGAAQPIRLDFFGDTLESLRSFDPLTQRSTGTLDKWVLRPVSEVLLDDAAIHRFRSRYREQFGGRAVVQLSPFAAPDEAPDTLDAGARPAKDFAVERANPNVNLFEAVRDYLDEERKSGRHAVIAAYSEGSADRLATVLREHGLGELRRVADGKALARLPRSTVGLAILPLEQGLATDNLVSLGERDILGDRLARAPRRRRSLDEFITEAASLASGDLVVHDEHGIGRYEGLETIDVAGAPHDCLKVLYAGDDRLFVPVENIEVLSRYGSE